MDVDFRKAFDIYYPVIEAARKVRGYYMGKKDGVVRVCSNEVGSLIVALNDAEKKYCIVKDEQ